MKTIFDTSSQGNIKRDNRVAIICLISVISAIVLFSLIFYALGKYMVGSVNNNPTDSTPPRALSSLGLEPVSTFYEDSMVGHGILHQGQALVAYEVPGSSSIIIGEMFTQHGTNLTDIHKNDHLMNSITEKALPLLESSHYVSDSNNTKGVTIYSMTDPQCPFCLRLWDSMRPYVDNEEVELRHVLVGIQGEVSINSAAAILESETPHEMLNSYLSAKKSGQEFEMPEPSDNAIKKVWENNDIMRASGAQGTPASYVIYPDGSSEYISGAFGTSKIEEIITKYKSLSGEKH